MSSQSRRRFIAGAVCPRCGLMDKIVVDLDTDCRHCVSCDFSEERPGVASAVDKASDVAKDQAADVRELPTRVSRAAARRVETPAEVITMVDSKQSNEPGEP